MFVACFAQRAPHFTFTPLKTCRRVDEVELVRCGLLRRRRGCRWPAWAPFIRAAATHTHTHTIRTAGGHTLCLLDVFASFCCLSQVSHVFWLVFSRWHPCWKKLVKVCSAIMQPVLCFSCCSLFVLLCWSLVFLSSYLPLPARLHTNPYRSAAVQLCLCF